MKNSPPPAAAPAVETQRLVLRGIAPGDLATAFSMWNNPKVFQFISGKPTTREETWRGMMMLAGMWPLLGYGYWAITDRATGRFIGQCGFADFQREIPAMEGPEIGWAMAPEFQGQGLATEATKAALQWLDEHSGHARTSCIIDPANATSLRVAAKLGYSHTADVTYKDKPVLVFHRQR